MSLARASRIEDRPFPSGPGPVKEVLDRTVAAVVLLIGAPWFALIALAIWLDSPGPILARERRVGQWGATFALLRFRSTPARTPRGGGGQAAPEETRVGRILRRFSLHELPQLINVLIGDMSLVGPRPQPRFVGGVHGDDLRRLALKPGLTGLWLAGPDAGRDVLLAPDRYQAAWSLSLDLRILRHAARTAMRSTAGNRR